ncbi:MAG: replication initiation factor domain-containing protein [Bacteroidales bacterium]|nr:replication initiation factor domain-containing protein [Bacteroidales bacterium]
MSVENKKNKAGVSNTPAGEPFYKISTTIDYLKFRFDLQTRNDFTPLNKIFEILDVDFDHAYRGPGMNGYEVTMKLAPGILFWFGGDCTRNAFGEDTCVIELKGEGCRTFEENYYRKHYFNSDVVSKTESDRLGWIELLEECKAQHGVCTRFDIPTDDLSGYITIDEIKEKIRKGEYSTKMRRIEETSSYENKDDMLDPYSDQTSSLQKSIRIDDSKNKGYSCTIGTRNHVQLCIYDKAAEQHNKGDFLNIQSWIRYEVRFYHQNADENILLLLFALQRNCVVEFIIGTLKSIFEFKEELPDDSRKRYRAKTWDKWNWLVSRGEEVNLFTCPKNMTSIEVTARWLVLSAAKALLKISACLGREITFAEIYTALVIKSFNKLNKSDLIDINAFLRQRGLEEYKSVEELKEVFLTRDDFRDEFKKVTVDLLLTKKGKAQLRKEGFIK